MNLILPFSYFYPGGRTETISASATICSIGDQDIGNDIERIREGKEQVAERFFTGEELSWIADAGTVREKDERIFRGQYEPHTALFIFLSRPAGQQ